MCKSRYDLLLSGSLAAQPSSKTELEWHVDRWNEVVAKQQLSYSASLYALFDDQKLKKIFMDCCLRVEKRFRVSGDEEYAPDVPTWTQVTSKFNGIVGDHVLNGWEPARRAAAFICGPRYRLMLSGELPAPETKLDKSIDAWNELLGSRRLENAFKMAESVLCPSFQEKIEATVDETSEETIRKRNLAYIPRNLVEQQNLIALLGQRCKDSIRADREKIIHRAEQTTQPALDDMEQGTMIARKRKVVGGEESRLDNEDSDMNPLPKRKKHGIQQTSESSFSNSEAYNSKEKFTEGGKNATPSGLEEKLRALEKTVNSMRAKLLQ
ncbi:hypothetical protein DL769_011133 [Monosporascus sp. CRB-8-3]|nr:hypothetical protein DL769_011133 [Monosporascus sp. CRB-8-3]